MSLLGLSEQRSLLRRELSRRIGYTNGLHDLFRFGRVTSYLHQLGPASHAGLRAVVLDREEVRGQKYADGVIEVAGALGLTLKSGTRLTLSDRGYALHALQQGESPPRADAALLLNAVLDSDGDATLNLLDLIADGTPSDSTGPLLMARLLDAIHIREQWITLNVGNKLSRDLVLQDLYDARERLSQAVDLSRKKVAQRYPHSTPPKLNPEQRLARFFDHTIQPRRGWLKDLGCLVQTGRGKYEVTEAGNRLLGTIRQSLRTSSSTIALPFSGRSLEALEVAATDNSGEMLWRATASLFRPEPSPTSLSPEKLLDYVRTIYPHVKLHVFNEATVESIFIALAAVMAVSGRELDRGEFQDELDRLCDQHPRYLHRLRQRHGNSGYIALRVPHDKAAAS